MALCKFCFEEVRDGIPMPGYEGASGIVHEECLAAAALRFARDPQKEGLLRYLVDYEEKHAPRDWSKEVSSGSADISWDWKQVGISFTRIRLLLDAGLISIVFSTNSGTDYAIVGRNVIKEALGRGDESPEIATEHLEIPEDLFDCITGYEDVKGDMKFTLKEGRRVHYLLIGPPATAKSLFLMELGRIKGTYFATGSRVTAAGLTDAFFTYQPKVGLAAGESVSLTKALAESDVAEDPLVAIRSAVEYIVGRGAEPSGEETKLTPRAKRVIELAKDEARWLGDSEVSSWHLLVGIMREGEGVASGVLESLGVPFGKVFASR